MTKSMGKVNEARPFQVGERGDVVRMEVGDEDMGNILWSKVKGRKLVDDQILLAQSDGSHPAIKALGEFLSLVEEAVGIARVEKHRAKVGMAKQREHGGEADLAPASAVDGDVFGGGAIACVQDVDFHKMIMSLRGRRSSVRSNLPIYGGDCSPHWRTAHTCPTCTAPYARPKGRCKCGRQCQGVLPYRARNDGFSFHQWTKFSKPLSIEILG